MTRWNRRDKARLKPTYVSEVLAEIDVADMNLVKQRTPSPSSTPVLICVLKDELVLLPDFFRHYREAGIDDFVLIDNGSSDGTLEYLKDQSDTTVYSVRRPFVWQRKQGWIMRAIRMASRDGERKWFLYVDADEHVVFHGVGHYSFEDLVVTMESIGMYRVRGMLIDMYPEGPLLESAYQPPERLLDSYPYFDAAGYAEARFNEVISRKGGPRQRAFGHVRSTFRPELTKYPLFRLLTGDVFANPHHIWPYERNFLSPCYLGILHFKFLPGMLDRIKMAVSQKSYFDNSLEYRCYQKVFQASPRLSLHTAVSACYVAPLDLVSNDLIKPVPRLGQLSALVLKLKNWITAVRPIWDSRIPGTKSGAKPSVLASLRRPFFILACAGALWATGFTVLLAIYLAKSQVPILWQTAVLALVVSGFLLAAAVGLFYRRRVSNPQRLRPSRSAIHEHAKNDSTDLAGLADAYPELLEVDRILHVGDRTNVLSLPRKNSIGAEIGVFTGKFSREIYMALQPSKLYLVDPWHTRFGTHYPNWGKYTAEGTLRTEAALAATSLRAGAMNGVAELIVESALDWLESMPEKSLDWVYLDTTHSYDDTLAELRAIARALADDGIIMGDDCQIDPAHRHHGLFRAVQDFAHLGEFEIIWMDGNRQWAMRRARG